MIDDNNNTDYAPETELPHLAHQDVVNRMIFLTHPHNERWITYIMTFSDSTVAEREPSEEREDEKLMQSFLAPLLTFFLPRARMGYSLLQC
ncbi:unnamed protein product [Protopolystoma xenopodis]|uniref:Uncharacterized protein n=1 Tax=Protopolystoma xenopodis TaxID=117903 RepID=A0A448XGV2_9PLAT|nr:unnamed protein product [Protopolystoma xenopodis]